MDDASSGPRRLLGLKIARHRAAAPLSRCRSAPRSVIDLAQILVAPVPILFEHLVNHRLKRGAISLPARLSGSGSEWRIESTTAIGDWPMNGRCPATIS
jgi:hypothetical protein